MKNVQISQELFIAFMKYFLLEQDETYGKSAFDSLKLSRDNLIKMGFADWF